MPCKAPAIQERYHTLALWVDRSLIASTTVKLSLLRRIKTRHGAAGFLIATINFLWPRLIYPRQKFYLFDERFFAP